MTAYFTGRALSWEIVDDVLEVAMHRDPANELGTTTLGGVYDGHNQYKVTVSTGSTLSRVSSSSFRHCSHPPL